jgi:hypothetical protein
MRIHSGPARTGVTRPANSPRENIGLDGVWRPPPFAIIRQSQHLIGWTKNDEKHRVAAVILGTTQSDAMKDVAPTPSRKLTGTAAAVVALALVTAVLWQIGAHNGIRTELAELRNENAVLKVQLEQTQQDFKKLADKSAGSLSPISDQAKARQLELLQEEINLATSNSENLKLLLDAGRGSFEPVLAADRELFSLKREVATLKSDRAGLKNLIEQEIEIVAKQVQRAQDLARDRLSRFEADRPKRELLKLQRELAAFK